MRFALVILFGLLSASAAFAATSGAGQPLVNHMEVSVSTGGRTPYAQEMVLLKVRTILYHDEVTKQEFEQPPLENFSWVQLGPDRSYRTFLNGLPAVVFERSLALFPIKSGKLPIGSFIHHLTLVDSNNIRHETDLRSPPTFLNVAPWAARSGGPEDSTWLPASQLSITDKWDPSPDHMTSGEIAHRTVTIEAKGITADRLPPVPRMRAPGAVIFGGTVERSTTMTPEGPVARGVYHWNFALTTALPVTTGVIVIPWFDTKSRRMRDAVIPARTMAFATAARENAGGKAPGSDGATLAAAGLAGFILASAILFIRRDHESNAISIMERWRLWRQFRKLRRTARSADPRAFRAALYDFGKCDPPRWRTCLQASSVTNELAVLDEHLFGRHKRAAPNLSSLIRRIAKAWKATGAL